jgi:hypothetical protein
VRKAVNPGGSERERGSTEEFLRGSEEFEKGWNVVQAHMNKC